MASDDGLVDFFPRGHDLYATFFFASLYLQENLWSSDSERMEERSEFLQSRFDFHFAHRRDFMQIYIYFQSVSQLRPMVHLTCSVI